MADPQRTANATWLLTMASITVVITGIYFAKGVLVPLTLAVLLSFLLSPICDWLERRRLGRIPAVLVTAIVGFTVLGIVIWTAAVQMTSLVPKIPEYQNNIEAKLNSVNERAVAILGKLTRTAQGMSQNLSSPTQAHEPRGTIELPFSVRVLSSPASPLQVFGGMFGTLVEVLGTTSIVIVLVVFFLIRREDLRDRFIHLVGQGRLTVTTHVLEDAAARVIAYLTTLFILNATFGISVGVGLYWIGVPNAILWGILAAAFRFVPYLGPWLAAVMPIGLSMAISTDWGPTILTVSLFVVLELVNNNLLEPWLYGKNTGVSAVAVLVAAVFWMWLWGPVGLLLATPLTVCVLVVGKHVPELSFLDILLGTEPVFEPKRRVYQRLLAGDQEEASELVEDCLKHQPLVEVYDMVLVPALAMAETHWQLGELNEGKHKFIMESMKVIIQDAGSRQPKIPSELDSAAMPASDGDSSHTAETSSSPLSVLCLPARSEADEIAALMLAQLVESMGCIVETVPITSLAGEMVDLVGQGSADVVCISATPPAAVMHARYLCQRLRARLPQVNLVVGLWAAQGDLTRAKDRIGSAAAVVATLAEAQEEIERLIQLRLQRPRQQAPPKPLAMTTVA